ncbi:hypothetical protein NOCARDAX2BIS_430010 [Nocardioides sp. AX2bis]|nr:hypothetical protein NOCARDAX2BIS_430010 [Nocardioides sp. AX2bis]
MFKPERPAIIVIERLLTLDPHSEAVGARMGDDDCVRNSAGRRAHELVIVRMASGEVMPVRP